MPNSKENFFPRVGRPGQNVKTKDKKEMDKRALEEKKVEKRPCTVCNCNSKGSKNETCDLGGQCHCKPTIQGLNCDQCQPGHFGFPTCQRK